MNASRQSEDLLQRVFREVWKSRGISPACLARRLGVKATSVEAASRKLARQGLVEFKAKGEKIRLNPNHGCVGGIDLGASHLHFALADLRGAILRERVEKVQPEDGPQKTTVQIKNGIRALTTEYPVRRHGRVLALGIGVPSAVDAARGVVANANNLPGWSNLDLRRLIESACRVPVYLENDANMAAIGEHWQGVARGVDNFVFVAIGTGVGAGVFIDGKLYRGRRGAAGEIYRMNLEWPRWMEDFGETGYFESYASGQGLAAAGRRLLGPDTAAPSAGLAGERDAHFVFEAFRRGSPQARAALELCFTILAVGLANVVTVLDPEMIVLGGGVSQGAPEFLRETVARVGRRVVPDFPPVRLSRLGDKAQTYGAVASALDLAREVVCRQL
jgi:glucokinase